MKNECCLATLNPDVLGKIFESLSTADLISLSKASPTVKNAIGERAIRERLINFDNLKKVEDTETVFKDFGKWIKSMQIGESDIRRDECRNETAFDCFLNLLVNHGTENHLETLSLHFDIGQVDLNLLNAAMPFFTNLRKFHYSSFGSRESFGHGYLFVAIILASTRLTSIQLTNTKTMGTWLDHPNMQNIQNFSLVNSSIFHESSWDMYFVQNPPIRSFIWIHGSIPNDVLCSKFVHNCPNLERFIDVQDLVPEDLLRETISKNRYDYISAANNLKCVHVTAYTRSGQDLIHFFGAVARTNTIKQLSIHFLRNAMKKFNSNTDRLGIFLRYPEFTSLKRLCINNHSSCMSWCEMLVNFVGDLVNLNEVNIASKEPIDTLQLTRIAMAPRNLTKLELHNAYTMDLDMAMDTIGKSREANNETITIMINAQQHMELKGCAISKNIKIIVV